MTTVSVDALSLTIAESAPIAASVSVDAFSITIAVAIVPYVPPLRAFTMPCQSWCLPLYYKRKY